MTTLLEFIPKDTINRGVTTASFVNARASHLKLFNLTITEWDIIDAFQNHVCAICKRPNKSGKRLSTDHSHINGLLRGLLCQRCNRILGKIEQKRFWGSVDVKVTIILLRAAADFLEHPTAVLALGREIYTFPGKFGTDRHREWLKKNRGVTPASYGGSTDDHRSSQRTNKTRVSMSRLRTVNRRN